MLIRGKITSVQGQAAFVAATGAVLPAPLSTLLLGGLSLLIGP